MRDMMDEQRRDGDAHPRDACVQHSARGLRPWAGACVWASCALLLTACPPTPTPAHDGESVGEGPHAVVRLRRTYGGTAGDRVDETCRVGGHTAFDKMDLVEALSQPRVDAFVVPVGPAHVEVTATFLRLALQADGHHADETEATCTAALDLAPVDGGAYSLDFTYRANGTCALTCLARVEAPDGSLIDDPCPRADAQGK